MDWDALASGDPRQTWPLLVPGVESRYFSSFDRRGGNSDGFRGRYAALYTRKDGEHVLVDALGPGVLRTLWFTGPEEGGEGLDLGQLRFYLDDEARPRFEATATELFGGKRPPFPAPLVADNKVSTGGYVSWVPIPYARRLIVTTQRRAGFYIAQYDSFPADAALRSWTPAARPAALIRAFEQAARGPLTPDAAKKLKQVPLRYTHRGAGTLELIRFEPQGAPDEAALNRARIAITWDEAKTPGVDAPLGPFFGSGLGAARVRALAFCADPGPSPAGARSNKAALEHKLPMPFWRGFSLRVTGMKGTLRIRLGPPRFARGQAGHLYASYHREETTTTGRDFTWLDVKASGKLVGTVLTIRPPTPETKRWWEGDLRSYADGRRTPGLHGTGHEDDHLGGWSNTFLSGPFSLPMHGEPRTVMIETRGEQYNARATMYRLWPGIHFWGALLHGVEHGSSNRVQADYAGLALYYALPGPPRLVASDHVNRGDERALVLESSFEGRSYRDTQVFQVEARRSPVRLTLTVKPADNRGCYLRRVYDQRLGRQRAGVYVDGQRVADWYNAEANTTLRWAERDLFLPAAFTRQKKKLTVEIRPVAGGPPWSAAEYRLLCISAR